MTVWYFGYKIVQMESFYLDLIVAIAGITTGFIAGLNPGVELVNYCSITCLLVVPVNSAVA